MEKEITIEIKHLELFVLLGFSLLIFALNLQVTLNSPIVFGDEGFHTYFAQKIWEEKEYFTWMPFEGTNLVKNSNTRPPYWNLLEAAFFLIFGFNEFLVKFLTPFIAMVTGIVIYLLVKKLFDEKVGLISAIIAITTPSFVTYSVLFYTDILFTFFTALAFLLFLIAEKENNKKYFWLSAIFAALAFLTKIPGIAFYAFYGLVFLYELIKFKEPSVTIKKYLPIFVILMLIPSGFFIRNYYYFKTPICNRIPYLQLFDISGCTMNEFKTQYEFAGRVEQTGTEANVYQIGIVTYLNFAYGSLWLVVFGVIGGFLVLLEKREKFSVYIFLFLILFFLLFPNVVGRAEDTARYTLGWVPLFSLLAGVWYSKIYEFLEKNQKYFGLIVFLFVFLLSYMNASSKLAVMAQVKRFSPTFFEACDWVKTNLPKNVSLYTVWAHRAIYNCQKNAVSIGVIPDIALSKDLNKTLEAAKANGITHIFIQKFSIDPTNKHYSENYDLEFVEFLEAHPEHFVKVYENGASLEQCKQYWQAGYQCDGNIIYEIKW
ncbi:MAG: glycosyltransferase family 39 protein [Candidatus Aenigmatarchaeota archaeon]